MAVDRKQLKKDQVHNIVEISKFKVLDKLFFEEGIEEDDIKKSVFAHKIERSYEFQEIVLQSQAKVEEKVKQMR